MELLSAYILHTRPWRDHSLLVDVLLQQGDRIRAIARSQRKQSGRSKGTICQPFRPLLIAVTGRSELKTIAQLDADGPAFALPDDRLYAGFYANEILLRALPEADPHPPLFIAYQRLLAALVDRQLDIEPPLRRFELTLLEELGYGIDFSHDAVSGEALRAGASYTFIAETGFVELEARQLRDHGNVYSGSHLLQVGQGQIESGASRTVAKQLMRQALRPLLGDKPLQSRMLYRPADSIRSR
jgi:DNA repair protein RecO (recombination protein O)